jgi:hypothetical protein
MVEFVAFQRGWKANAIAFKMVGRQTSIAFIAFIADGRAHLPSWLMAIIGSANERLNIVYCHT